MYVVRTGIPPTARDRCDGHDGAGRRPRQTCGLRRCGAAPARAAFRLARATPAVASERPPSRPGERPRGRKVRRATATWATAGACAFLSGSGALACLLAGTQHEAGRRCRCLVPNNSPFLVSIHHKSQTSIPRGSWRCVSHPPSHRSSLACLAVTPASPARLKHVACTLPNVRQQCRACLAQPQCVRLDRAAVDYVEDDNTACGLTPRASHHL